MTLTAAWAAAVAVALAGEPRAWEDEVVYTVILEKFWDGDPSNNVMKARYGRDRAKYEGGFWGGDLKGVRDRLDDLADLGVTTLLLYPVVQNDESAVGKYLPTGYRPKDYERVDRNFGDEADLRALVAACHARGMRVLLDLPLALPGFEHPYVNDPSKKDWFGEPTRYGVRRWKAENPEVADFLIGVARRWKERSGCDGFRVDSAQLMPVAFWKRFVAEVKAGSPGGSFLVVAELAVHPREIGRAVAEAGFDGAYDFSTNRSREVFGRGEGVGLLAFIAREAREFYPAPRRLMALVDNYEDAFVSVAKGPEGPRALLALTYTLTLDRVPLLFPGDELGLAFTEVGGAFPPGRRDSPFYREVKARVALRRREPALRRGGLTVVSARDPVFAFERADGGDRVLVVLNNSDRTHDFAAPLGGRPWEGLRLDGLLGEGPGKPAGDGSALSVGPFGARVLRVR